MGGASGEGSLFPGQVVERGGEFIDTGHKTMIRYAREFGLKLVDIIRNKGEVFYHFDGSPASEAAVVDEFRALVPAMRADLRRLSKAPTADDHTAADLELDFTNLDQYLRTRGAGRLAFLAIQQAYVAEYGLAIDRQSCLNFLLFIHADRRSKFTPFGVFSDERYHVAGGNEGVARALAERVSGQITFGMSLTKVKKLASGKIRLSFGNGTSADHEAVVLAAPFSVLRAVDLNSSDLPIWKRLAIDTLGYGDNAKMMVGFQGPFWRGLGSNGSSYSNLANHQTTWETDPTRATQNYAVLTDYSGAERGRTLNPAALEAAAGAFIGDLNQVFPGAIAAARRVGGQFAAHLEHWASNPLTKGSYTCYLPGQFTSIAGNEGKPVENIFFAGEHTNSFYEWQGFMEGALLSGVQAAEDIVRKPKKVRESVRL